VVEEVVVTMAAVEVEVEADHQGVPGYVNSQRFSLY